MKISSVFTVISLALTLQACGGGSNSNKASNINSPEDDSIELDHKKLKPSDDSADPVILILETKGTEYTGLTLSISLDCEFPDGTYIKGNQKLTYPMKSVSGLPVELQESVKLETSDNEGNSCFQFINKGILVFTGNTKVNGNRWYVYHQRDGKETKIGTFERDMTEEGFVLRSIRSKRTGTP